MKLLILGGTVFLGRHFVEETLKRGHEVTLFTRGIHNAELYPEAEKLVGDRDGNLEVLRGRHWDACIDTSGFVPRIVRDSAEVLKDSVNHYTFISSISVYADFATMDLDEDAPVATLADETTENVAEAYGELKALCERAAEAVLPGRVLNVRSGLLVGPYDKTDRFTYWPTRVARGGEVLAPGRPDRQIQIIDARDLVNWTLNMVETNTTGVFNVTGPEHRLTMADVLETCQDVAESNARFTWIEDDCLTEQQVGEWSELPLWIRADHDAGMMAVNIDKALANGLKFRPLKETVRDTLLWDGSRDSAEPRKAGLDAEKEGRVLEAWAARQVK